MQPVLCFMILLVLKFEVELRDLFIFLVFLVNMAEHAVQSYAAAGKDFFTMLWILCNANAKQH